MAEPCTVGVVDAYTKALRSSRDTEYLLHNGCSSAALNIT
jgi:hypothetical protein